MVLAESPTLDGGALFIGLLVLLVTFALLCVFVFGGAVLAFRSGRGSRRAQWGWAAVAATSLLVVAGLGGVTGLAGWGSVYVAGPLVLQAVVYFVARATSSDRRDGQPKDG